MKKILLLLTLTLFLGATAIAELPTYSKVHLKVVPGVSAGPLKIGEIVGPEVYELLGPPSKKTEDLVLWSMVDDLYFAEGILVKLDENGRVRQIVLSAVNATTTQGIRFGDSMSQIKKAYPKGKFEQQRSGDYWQTTGFSVRFDMKNKAETFFVQ